MADAKYLAWIDLESTGSDRAEDPIIEFAMKVTKPAVPFDVVAEVQAVVLPPGQQWSHRMNPTVLEMHTVNGLLADVFSPGAVSIGTVDSRVVTILNGLGKPHDFIIAGSGVSHFDRAMIAAQMPKLDRFLQYGAVDVGVLRRTLKVIGLGSIVEDRGKKAHRSMADVDDHIAELLGYAHALGMDAESNDG